MICIYKVSGLGGTGRHASLRCWCREAWKFKSSRPQMHVNPYGIRIYVVLYKMLRAPIILKKCNLPDNNLYFIAWNQCRCKLCLCGRKKKFYLYAEFIFHRRCLHIFRCILAPDINITHFSLNFFDARFNCYFLSV